MKLQILVPQYNETDGVVKPLLDSIAIQQGIDFNEIGVVICNDGSGVFLSEEFLSGYPFRIEYHKEPHRGVSGTRNACLDYATADYVMFCDADDMFLSVCGVFVIFLNIAQGFDSLNSVFIEETVTRDTGELIYVTHENDGTFVHGKVHRRQYLLDNNIRWNESLTIHEDSFFNILCQNLSPKVRYCTTPFYLWRWRSESVCRKDPLYMFKTYSNLIESSDALIGEFIKRGLMDKAMYFMANMVFDTYYTMNKEDWVNQDNKEYRDSTEARFGEYVRKWHYLWETLPQADKIKISNVCRERNLQSGLLLESITIFDWLERIKGEQQCPVENKEKF